MGTWGTGIFDDDVSEEVRDVWRDAVLDTSSPEEATALVLEKYPWAHDAPDDEGADVFWLGLAAAQMQTGRLQDEVRDRALEVIASGRDVQRWDEGEPELAWQRKNVLENLRRRLLGPQRPPTKLRRPSVRRSPLDAGDVVLIHGENDRTRRTYFVVTEVADTSPAGSTAPVVVALLWEEQRPPSIEEMRKQPLLRDPYEYTVDGLFEPETPAVATWQVYSPTRGKNALHNVGEVVARQVFRPDAPPFDHKSYATWPFLAAWIETTGSWYHACIDATKSFHAR